MLDKGIDIKQLFEVVDFANMMTYDMNGAWSATSGHHTALYGNPNDPNYANGLSVDQTVRFLKEHGAPSEKIVIGAAFYTRGWNEVAKGTDPNTPGLFQPAEKAIKMQTKRRHMVRTMNILWHLGMVAEQVEFGPTETLMN